MIKLKKIIKESFGDRKFGEPLPTFSSVMKNHQLGKVYTDKDRPPFQVKEGQKRQSREITAKFDKAYLNFAKEVRDVIKMIDRYQGDKTDGKIIDKAYSKGLVPLDKLMKSWNSGQQKNPNIDEGSDFDDKELTKAQHDIRGGV